MVVLPKVSRLRLAGLAALLAAGIVFAGAQRSVAQPMEVDLALVLAVDISYSMDEEEQRLQRGGYIEGLRSPAILDAINRGAIGKIAVTYIEWAGTGTQQVIVPWRIIEGPDSVDAFIATIEEMPTRRAYRTSISGGIDFSVKLLDEAPVRALRRVIDVSGDGPNNQGRPVTQARDEALAKGITINGLPIALKRPGYLDIENLDLYYQDCVIGGQGSFLVPIRERRHFAEAIRSKLILEISGLEPVAGLIKPAQDRERVSCSVGERQWNERMGN